MSRAPFTASHPVKPVDGDGELGIPKPRDAAAGSHRKRDPMNTIPTAIRLESKYPVDHSELLSVAEMLATLEFRTFKLNVVGRSISLA